MSETTTGLIIGGIFGLITTVVTYIAARRKIEAERIKILAEAQATKSGADSVDVTAFEKFTDLLKKQQDRNAVLYEQNVILEKANTDLTRTNESMITRLATRDEQLSASTKQLEMLRDLAKSVPVTDTLKTQLEAMNTIVANLQDAQKQMAVVMEGREAAYKALFESNRLTRKEKEKEHA